MNDISLGHQGAELRGELFLPDHSERSPGILIAHSALGLSAHERMVAAELAGLGYTALAIDMFGVDCGRTPDEAGRAFGTLASNPGLMRSRMNAWLACLKTMSAVDADRIATMGYCFGGMCVLELARSGAEVNASVSFHGLLTTQSPAETGAISGEIVAWCGGNDPYAPQADIDAFRDEMAAAGARCQISVFGDVAHGFTNPAVDALEKPGVRYDALAERVSWGGTVALLQTVLGQPPALETSGRTLPKLIKLA